MRAMVWFRSDLRAADNTALHEAARRASDGVVGLYVISPGDWQRHDVAPVRIDLILRTLAHLSAALGALNMPLRIETAPRHADVPGVVLRACEVARCDALFHNREYEPNEARRDEKTASLLAARGVATHAFDDQVILPPGDVRTGAGGFFTVFTPYKNAWLRVLAMHHPQGPPIFAAPRKQAPIAGVASSATPSSIPGVESLIAPKLWPAGEAHALTRLGAFAAAKITNYADARDFPAQEAASALSPYLAIGAISPRRCLQTAMEANAGSADGGASKSGPAAWISELIWREFYTHVLVGFPRVGMHRAFKRATDRIVWSADERALDRWRRGMTGVPIVDAGMRQLAATGWMHNRVRMITAMYLAKDLFLDWRLGERHFMRSLVDGFLASNNGGWQWSASTGADAAPYFRIFNPTSQSTRFDPSGEYIRRWVPELRALDVSTIHDPSPLGPSALSRLDYPRPIVDHAVARAHAISAFKALAGIPFQRR